MPYSNYAMRAFFDPFNVWSRPTGTDQRARRGLPIDIKAQATDPGLSVTKQDDAIVLRGTAEGPELMGEEYLGLFPTYEKAQSVSFSLDAEHAPTRDVFGGRDYSEKNSRRFVLITREGQTALSAARALAAKVNAEDDFRATVANLPDGGVKLSFERK